MKLQRVYLDTSVLGGCFDPEFAPWSNGLMRDFCLRSFAAIVSEITEAEVADAPPNVRGVLDDLLAGGAERLTVSDEVVRLADTFQARGVLSPRFYDDGLHVALATVHGVDVIVSWNFRHIVHLDKIRLFSAISIERGYAPVLIYSPREVTHHELQTYEEAVRL